MRRRDGRVGDIADREELQSGASRCRLGCEPGEIELLEGRIAQARNGRSITLAELATEELAAEESFANNRHTYSYGAHAAHVAVDPDTGHVELIDYVAVEDVGRIINPTMLRGQIVGAVVQGLGGTLLEHLAYDEERQLLSGSLADYLLPTASDFLQIRTFGMEAHPSPFNRLGAKERAKVASFRWVG